MSGGTVVVGTPIQVWTRAFADLLADARAQLTPAELDVLLSVACNMLASEVARASLEAA